MWDNSPEGSYLGTWGGLQEEIDVRGAITNANSYANWPTALAVLAHFLGRNCPAVGIGAVARLSLH